jgi:RNA polymerase sigma factor (sigma-70 family)
VTNAEFKALASACLATGGGQQQAIEQFCNKLRPYVAVVLSRLSPLDTSTAEDAVQTTFLKYIQMFVTGNISPAALTPAYMITVAKHCLIDEIRRRDKHISFDDLLHDIGVQPAMDANRSETSSESVDVVLATLGQMSHRCRFALERYYLAGIKGPQLAVELGISPESTPVILKRCRDELKRRLSSVADLS